MFRTKAAMSTFIGLFLSLLVVPERVSGEPFRFVALPDTQRYAENLLPPDPLALDPKGTYRFFTDQTRWLADNAEKLGIRYVVHLGDVVQTATDLAQWERARAAMDILDDAEIPYGLVIGNHDLLRDKGRTYDAFLSYFGPQRFKDKPYFRGASPEGTSTYQVIQHGEYSFLFLNLSYATPKQDVDWAHGVLNANRDKVVIVSTHAYLWDMGVVAGRYGEEVGFSLVSSRLNRAGRIEGAMTSQELYESFVSKHPNILMVQCGHSGLDWYRTDGTNGAGKPILEVLTNYQSLTNGGEGYLRIYEIDPQGGTLSARSFSPTHARQRTIFEHFVQMIGLSFEMRGKSGKVGIDGGIARNMQAMLLKRDVVPEMDVVGNQPEFKRDPERYRQLYRESFLGQIPADAGAPNDWEALWMKAFARDPDNPADYGPNSRAPAFTIPIDLDSYVVKPEPTSASR